MQMWMRLGIGVAAIAIAVAAGTAVYVMRDDGDEPSRQVSADDRATVDGEGQDTSAGAFAAMCAAEQPDCDDTVDAPLSDGAARCTPEFPDCDDTIGFGEYACAADDLQCLDYYTCISTLPAPVDEPIVNDPAVSGPAVDLPVEVDPQENGASQTGEEITDEELQRLEDLKAREAEACGQGGECVPGPAVDCGPVDPCVPGPAVDCGPIDCGEGPVGACLPPECAVSSDGEVACPTDICVLPEPDLPAETIAERCQAACSSPGFDPGAQSDPATDPAVSAPEGAVTCQIEPGTGRGTDAAPPQTEPGAPAPAPIE